MKSRASFVPLTKKQIALIHVAKRDLALDDDTYRDILKRFGGVESAADLSMVGFEYVMKYFTALGFRSSWTTRTFGNRKNMASPAQVDLIRSLWKQFAGEGEAKENALNEWLQKYHQVATLRFVDSKKAGKIIPALKAMNQRKQDQI